MDPPEQHPPPPPHPDQPPPPSYAPPPYYGPHSYPQPAQPPRRNRTGLYAIVAIVLVIILAAGGYFVAGSVYAQSRLSSSLATYNKVIEHQNGMVDFFNSLSFKTSDIDPSSATKAAVQAAKAPYQQLISHAQSSEPQVEQDQASLVTVQADLKQNQWLTILSRSSLDRRSNKIDYLRGALDIAKEVLQDYAQYGSFVLTLLDCANDVLTIEDASSKHDFVGLSAAVAALKSDTAKGITLDHGPGLSADMDLFMHDLQRVANDFANLINAAATNNQSAITAAENTLTADGKKLDSYDFDAMDTSSKSFFTGLTDQYNRYIAQANSA